MREPFRASSLAVRLGPLGAALERFVTGRRLGTRAQRVFVLLVSLWILNACDLGFTLYAHLAGQLVELNPIAAVILSYGDGALVIYKLSVLAAGSSMLWWTRRFPLTEAGMWCLLAINVAVIIRWHRFYDVLTVILEHGALFPQ